MGPPAVEMQPRLRSHKRGGLRRLAFGRGRASARGAQRGRSHSEAPTRSATATFRHSQANPDDVGAGDARVEADRPSRAEDVEDDRVTAADAAPVVRPLGMTNRATPNLPSRDLAATAAFYTGLGFVETFRDDGWLIMERDGLTLEFFPYPDLDPATSSFGCCLRLDDLDGFLDVCRAAGVPIATTGWPRLHLPEPAESKLRIGHLIDPDCTQLRLVANP